MPFTQATSVGAAIDAILSDSRLRAELAAGIVPATTSAAADLSGELARLFGPATMAIIHYGSRARGVDIRADSAYDFFVVVDDYHAAYRSLAKQSPLRVSPGIAARLAEILPPNVHALPASADRGRPNKACIVSQARLRDAARLRRADHFVPARLFQTLHVSWTRDQASADAVAGTLVELRARTFEWAHCFLPERFDAESYCRTLMNVSFSSEIRPEASGRAGDLFNVQRAFLVPLYRVLLDALTDSGVLRRDGTDYRQQHAPTPEAVRRWRWYFALSSARSSARWSKHLVLYDAWVDYIYSKITRHNVINVELTERERRWPLLFLWPKVLLFFRERSKWEARR